MARGIPDLPTRIELAVGDVWKARLAGMGSIGYEWVGELEAGVGVVDLVLAPDPGPSPPKMVGEPPNASNVDVLVEVRALRPGTATIRFIQRRPWQLDQPLVQHRIDMVVRAGDEGVNSGPGGSV